MMKKQEVKKMIFSGLQNLVEKEGFRLRKNEDAFVRIIPGGAQRIYVPLWDYNPEFTFSLTIAITLEAVEEIFFRFTGSPLAYQPLQTATTLTQLDYFTAGAKKQYRVTNEAEISCATEELSKILSDKVWNYFESYSSLSALDRAINSGAIRPIDSTQMPSKAMHAVILARLAGNTNFERIVTEYQTVMRDFPAMEKEHFTQLVDFLRKYDPHEH